MQESFCLRFIELWCVVIVYCCTMLRVESAREFEGLFRELGNDLLREIF